MAAQNTTYPMIRTARKTRIYVIAARPLTLHPASTGMKQRQCLLPVAVYTWVILGLLMNGKCRRASFVASSTQCVGRKNTTKKVDHSAMSSAYSVYCGLFLMGVIVLRFTVALLLSAWASVLRVGAMILTSSMKINGGHSSAGFQLNLKTQLCVRIVDSFILQQSTLRGCGLGLLHAIVIIPNAETNAPGVCR